MLSLPSHTKAMWFDRDGLATFLQAFRKGPLRIYREQDRFAVTDFR